jgi:integrase
MRFNSNVVLSLSSLLTKRVLNKAQSGKKAAMRTHNLVRTLPTPQYTRTSKGTDAEDSGTKSAYEDRWSHFHAFCVLVGFYTCSLVLDRDACPDRPIPVEIDTIRLYVAYMMCPTEEQLVHPDTKVPIVDVTGKSVYCTGTWQSPTNLIKFRAAMLALDTLHSELTGPEYVEKCLVCIEQTEMSSVPTGRTATRSSSNVVTHCPCDLHTDGARVRSRGSTMNAPKVKQYMAYMKNQLRTYEKRGNIQLLPSEIRRIRTALLAENSIEGLQYWTMVIMGIKLFARISELLSIRMDDFDPSLMLLENKYCHVAALVVKILGKGGNYHWLSIYADDVFPELCPIRALLLYISLSGITEGYLFPKCLDSSTESTGNAGVCTAHYSYPTFIRKMKLLLTCTLCREMGPRDIFGTHILRKTAYLFAIFGMLRQFGGEVRNLHDMLMTGIMESARHSCIMNVRYYSRDACTRYEWDRAKAVSTENDVPNWRSIHIIDTNVIRAATETSRTAQQHLSKIALVYLTQFLLFSVQVPVATAVEKAFAPKPPSATESSVDLYVKERMSSTDYDDYLKRKEHDVSYNPLAVPAVLPSVPNSTASNRTYANELRATLAGKSVPQKIRTLGSMYLQDKELSPSTFTGSYRTFYYSKVKPVGLCLALCYAGDSEAFGQRLDELPNKGKYKCCSLSNQCESTV